MPAKTTTQTVRINGVRTILTTRNGKVTTKAALPLESALQAAQVRRLRAMPEYAFTADDVLSGKGRFTIAGDQNSGKRGFKAATEAKAAGLMPGEADLRIYLSGGRFAQIENKVGAARLEDSQKARHPLMAALGHPVTVIRATTEDDAADQAEAFVRSLLAANDNAATRPGGAFSRLAG